MDTNYERDEAIAAIMLQPPVVCDHYIGLIYTEEALAEFRDLADESLLLYTEKTGPSYTAIYAATEDINPVTLLLSILDSGASS